MYSARFERRALPMPWKETCAMEERAKFIAGWLYGEETMTGLCGSFGVSRKTGYKWLGRFRSEGERGLTDRSRRPHRSGRLIDGELAAVVNGRQLRPGVGMSLHTVALRRGLRVGGQFRAIVVVALLWRAAESR